jgi:hypothetical protein
MSASVLVPPIPSPLPSVSTGTKWIISRRDDLIWFIGSAAISYLALLLMAAGTSLTLIAFIWLVGVDGPHVIATVTRTYFDRSERARLGWLLWVLVPLMLVGPAMVAIGQAPLFFLLAVCWQHYHIVKQHVGFVMLWKAKNKERDAFEMKLDQRFLIGSTMAPLVVFVLKTRLTESAITNRINLGIEILCGLIVAAYAIFQFNKWRSGRPMNAPKLMLLGVLIPLQWLAFLYAAGFGDGGVLRVGIALGLFHSFQYHRLLWFHNKNRYQTPGAREKYGIAAVLAKSFGSYILVAIGLHALLSVAPQTLYPTTQWLIAMIWGFAFTHYFLDSKIWRVRGDKELAAALHI